MTELIDTAWRYQCPTCGRFLAASTVTEETFRDEGEYYGISTVLGAWCERDGIVAPRYVPVRWELAPC